MKFDPMQTINIPDMIKQYTTSMMGAAGLAAIQRAIDNFPFDNSETVVEIGVYHGDTTVFIGKYLRYSGKDAMQICIDPFERAKAEPLNAIGNRAVFEANVADNLLDVITIAEPSEAASELIDEYIGLLVIDGSHLYENTKKDLALYAPKVVPGGYMFVDDYGPAYPGVVRALDEFIVEHPEFTLLEKDCFMLFQKRLYDRPE
jgi:cephalosporin hydroxylase